MNIGRVSTRRVPGYSRYDVPLAGSTVWTAPCRDGIEWIRCRPDYAGQHRGQRPVAPSIPAIPTEIPGVGWDKINASYTYGGPPALVEHSREVDGLTVDLLQIGMGCGARQDAVYMAELCYDHDSNDEYSGLN